MNKWKITYKGTDITSSVQTVEISSSANSFCYELNVTFADDGSVLSSHDWSSLTPSLDVEVFIEDGGQSLGKFFVEKPTYTITKDVSKLSGFWGRSSHAVLAEPFSYIITGNFDTKTDVDTIFDFIIDTYGRSMITYSSAHNLMGNFAISANDYNFEEVYPIDVLLTLVDLCGGELVPYKDGTFRIVNPNHDENLGSNDYSISTDIFAATKTVTIPSFGNRVKVLGTIGSGNSSFDFVSDSPCWTEEEIAAGTVKYIIGQVQENDEAVDGADVQLYFEDTETNSNDFASVPSTKQSGPTDMMREVVNVSNYTEMTLEYIPSEIVSIKYYYGGSSKNYASGATIDGNTVTLAQNAPYCDATMLVYYKARGVVKIPVTPQGDIGTTTLVVSIGVPGSEDRNENEIELHFENQCACPLSVNWIQGFSPDAGMATYNWETKETVAYVRPTFYPVGTTYNFNAYIAGPIASITSAEVSTVDGATYNSTGISVNVEVADAMQGKVKIPYSWYKSITIPDPVIIHYEQYYKKTVIDDDPYKDIPSSQRNIPLYAVVSSSKESVKGKVVQFSFFEGGKYGTLSSSQGYTKLNTLEEPAKVEQINQTVYGITLKNKAVSVTGVYRSNGSEVFYDENIFTTLDDEGYIAYVSSSSVGEEVVVRYSLYCALVYFSPNIGNNAEKEFVVRARIKSTTEDPVYSDLSLSVKNLEASLNLTLNDSDVDDTTTRYIIDEEEDLPPSEETLLFGTEDDLENGKGADIKTYRHYASVLKSGETGFNEKNIIAAVRGNSRMVSRDKNGKTVVSTLDFEHDGDSKKSYPTGVILK